MNEQNVKQDKQRKAILCDPRITFGEISEKVAMCPKLPSDATSIPPYMERVPE